MPLKTKSKPTETSEHLMTVREIAARDCCSEKTVRRAIAAGLLEAIRVGPGARLLRVHPTAHARYRKLLRA